MRTLASLAKFFSFSFIKSLIFPEFDIYTDGSHKDGLGSWAFVIVKRGKVVAENFGYCKNTSSDRMELQAAIEALQVLPDQTRVRIHTDSRTLITNMQTRVPEWKRLGWNSKNIIANIDPLKRLNSLSESRKVSWLWVKAHSGNVHNERCDLLCREARIIQAGAGGSKEINYRCKKV